MYKLYYSPGACSLAVHAVLNELGVQYSAEKVDIKNKSEKLLQLNPRGSVPILEEDGKVIREGAAILTHLVDSNNSTLLPRQNGYERAKALEWLAFANSTLHPAYGKTFALPYLPLDDASKDKLKDAYAQQIQKYWDEIEKTLQDTGGYLTGTQPSAADFLVTVIANWTPGLFQDKVKFGPKTQNLLRSISSRPSYQKALKDEGVEYKAVA